jgi:hypothetical protein
MPTVNPGPAITGNTNAVAQFIPVNTQTNSTPSGINNLRCLGVARAVSLAVAGDAAVMPVIDASTYNAFQIVIGNAQGGSAATANLTINTGPGVTGTNLRAAGVLTGVTGPLTALVAAAASPTVINTSQNLFVNVSVVAVGVTVDIFVIGFDLS